MRQEERKRERERKKERNEEKGGDRKVLKRSEKSMILE